MGLLKKMGKAVGGAIVKTGKWTAASIKKKNLQNETKRKILNKFNKSQLKQLLKDYNDPGPELPERGYFKKSDYVNYIYRYFRLKTVIQWAKKHKIPIKDIMDEYKRKMDAIEAQYGINKESKAEDEKQGVEDIEVDLSEFEEDKTQKNMQPYDKVKAEEDIVFEKILESIKNDFSQIIKTIRIVDERSFQNNLYTFLRSRFVNMRIEQHVPWRADLLLDGKYALELKYADNFGTLDKGVREIKDYKRHTKYVAIIMLDIGKYDFETIEKYVTYYKEEGAKVIVLHSPRSRRRKR